MSGQQQKAVRSTVGSGDVTGHQHFHFPSVMKTEALSGLRRGRSGNKREDLQAWQLRWGREGRTLWENTKPPTKADARV